jgi:hypothetical protein
VSRASLRETYSDIGQTAIFTLEFHIPFFALRREKTFDRRAGSRQSTESLSQSSLREGSLLPFGNNNIDDRMYYYEASNSLLVTGPDEWMWTSYCFADTYYNSERGDVEDFETADAKVKDAASDRHSSLGFPVWDPRQYYLMILSRRLMQATNEWSNLVSVLEVRLTAFVREFRAS